MTDVLGRVLLFSDLSLGRPYAGAPAALGVERRMAQREALVEVLQAAREHQVDAIACAGNLFDRRAAMPDQMDWLLAALRSAPVPVLIAPGDQDYLGPFGGYDCYDWPEHVTVFSAATFQPVEINEGLTIWGAAHTEAHRRDSPLRGAQAPVGGVNVALFHGAERRAVETTPGPEPTAVFDADEIERAGFDHALVGHFDAPLVGERFTYAGSALQHEFAVDGLAGASLVTFLDDGTVERNHLATMTAPLHDVTIDLTGVADSADALARIRQALPGDQGWARLAVVGVLNPEVAITRQQIDGVASAEGQVVVDWQATTDLAELADEPTVRGRFVIDASEAGWPAEQAARVLRVGLRALAGHDDLEGSP